MLQTLCRNVAEHHEGELDAVQGSEPGILSVDVHVDRAYQGQVEVLLYWREGSVVVFPMLLACVVPVHRMVQYET